MNRYLALFAAMLLAGCSSPDRPGYIEDLPPLTSEIIEAPPEVVYTRLSEAFETCFSDSEGVSIFENKREMHEVIGIVSENLSAGYTGLLKVTVASGGTGASRVTYSWQNAFWENYAVQAQRWARGETPVCR